MILLPRMYTLFEIRIANRFSNIFQVLRGIDKGGFLLDLTTHLHYLPSIYLATPILEVVKYADLSPSFLDINYISRRYIKTSDSCNYSFKYKPSSGGGTPYQSKPSLSSGSGSGI